MAHATTRSRNVSRCQASLTLLLERHHRCLDVSNFRKYCANVLRQVSLPTYPSAIATNASSLLPAIAFTLDMYRRTGEFYGINEALFASALAAMVFSILACQPLTIVGVTGLIALFNYTIYDIVGQYDISLYPQVMAWTGIWAAIFHWIVALLNFSDYMGYITDFSSGKYDRAV